MELASSSSNANILEGHQESNFASSQHEPPRVSGKLMARYDRNQIYDDVWEAPLKKVAKKLGVAPETLGYVCRKLHIPLPEIGYWNKKAAGKPVSDRPPLDAVRFIPVVLQNAQRTAGDLPVTVSGRLMEQYNREELYEDAWKFPFTQIETKWGLDACRLSHLCKNLKIPVPGVGYWNKIEAGKPVPSRPPFQRSKLTLAI
jgi:hypothetical protein